MGHTQRGILTPPASEPMFPRHGYGGRQNHHGLAAAPNKPPKGSLEQRVQDLEDSLERIATAYIRLAKAHELGLKELQSLRATVEHMKQHHQDDGK